jgi:hypothetical protein
MTRIRQLLLAMVLTLPALPLAAEAPAQLARVDSLEQLAVLCATEPGSEQADSIWASWVRAHPEADLDEVVTDVVSRAMTLRSMAGAGVEPVRPARRPSRAALSEHLLRLGRSTRATLRRERPMPETG